MRLSLNELQHLGRLHIVGIAALAALTFGWAFTGERPWITVGIAALDWFLVNLLNRVVDVKEDEANAIPGTDFARDHRLALRNGGFALLAASLVGGGLVAPAVLPWRIAFHLLGLSYNWRLFGRVRLKETYGFKNLASGVGFLLTCFAYPLAAAWTSEAGLPLLPDVTGWTIGVAATFFLLFELSYEVVYDLRDVDGDRGAGVPTFPVVHGERYAVRIVYGLLASSGAVLVGGYATGVVPWRLVVMVLAPLMQAELLRRWLRRGITGADCVRLTWIGTFLLAAYHVWIALELPGV